MNELKYQIVQFLFLVLLGLGAYWALTQLDSGVSYNREHMVQIHEPVETPSEITFPDPSTIIETPSETENEPVVEETPLGDSELESELQEILNANVILQSGSRGARVGTVQKFLDWYFDDRTVSIDNDYGPGTERLVREFQTKELNGGDGRVGPNTLRKMIEVLSS